VPVLGCDDNDIDRDDHHARNEPGHDQTLIPLEDANESNDGDDSDRQHRTWSYSCE